MARGRRICSHQVPGAPATIARPESACVERQGDGAWGVQDELVAAGGAPCPLAQQPAKKAADAGRMAGKLARIDANPHQRVRAACLRASTACTYTS